MVPAISVNTTTSFLELGPLGVSILSALVLWIGLFLFFRKSLAKGSYHMDPGEKPGAFEPHLGRYQEIARLLLALSTATIAFLFHFLVNLPREGDRNSYSLVLEMASSWALAYLSCSVLFLLCYLVFLSSAYESYAHRTSRYTHNKYAISLALGYSGFIWFLVAYIVLAVCVIS
jgi:hypothetical protein